MVQFLKDECQFDNGRFTVISFNVDYKGLAEIAMEERGNDTVETGV